jgi:phage N-6-adenine-methyltransferase
MSEPRNNRGASKQDYETPWELIRAVEQSFGALSWDLACTGANKKAPRGLTVDEDSLSQDWAKLDGHLWLNPPFENIGDWARKCAASTGARITMLVPASIDSRWFERYVHGIATVFSVAPRVKFVGAKDPYPKPLMLCAYGLTAPTKELQLWRWK